MARKSAASMAVRPVVSLPQKIPEPPKSLTDPQSEIWRMVLASRAGEMIAPEALPVLVEYCRAVVSGNQIAEQIDAFRPAWLKKDDGLRRWDRLLAMQDRCAKSIMSLATKLRITPQSRVHKDTAGTIAAKGSRAKPWEIENGD